MIRYAHAKPSHNIQFLSNTPAIFCFFILCLFGGAVGASELCNSTHSRPELKLFLEDPQHSHRIFSEDRWQCVSAVNKEISHTEYGSFETALAHCVSLNLTHQAPDKDNFQWRNFSEAQKDLYCITATGVTPHDVYIGHAIVHLQPWGYGEYTPLAEYPEISSAGILNWKADDSSFWARLEYTPEFKSSRCSDAVCDAHATTGSQFAIPLIEPAHGTVDFSIPLLSADFPGLLPLSLHYSSWNTVKKTHDYTLGGIDSDKSPPYPSREDSQFPSNWLKSWHHSYDKKLQAEVAGPVLLGYQLSRGRGTLRHLYLYLPSEDVLVFAKDSSSDWRCVSHPGVESRIRQLGDNKFELYRPDGYREVYDGITGDLNQVFYPDGRSINITRVGTAQGLKETTIQQSYPPATAVVLSDLAGNIQEVHSHAKKSYRYKFRYKNNPRNIGSPQLVSITRPDGAVVAIEQTALGHHVANTSYLLNSIKLDGKELLAIGYDEKARATSVKTLSGNNFSVNYTGVGSASLRSAAGVSVNATTTKKRVSKTEFLGEVNASLLASVACDDCGFNDAYNYNEGGVISSVNRAGDSPFTANFTAQGLLSDLHYGESESRTFSWNPELGQLLSVSGTDVLATTINYTDSRVTKMTSVAGASSRSVNVDRVNGDAKKLSGVNKDILLVNYTSKGFISAAKNRLGQAYKFQAHNHLGQPTKVIDPNNIETELRYDVLGRLLGVSRGDVAELAVDYNVLGLPVTASSNGKTMAFTYDEHQRLTSLSASCKPSIEYSYDANGYINSIKREHGGKTQVTHYEFDADGTPTKQTSTYDDKTTTVNFNKKGQVVEVQDDENIRSYAYNGNGYLTGVNLNGNATSSYTIGVMGRLDSALSLGGRNTSLTYTDFGQLKKQQNTNFGFRTYAYSSFGNLTRRTTPVYDTRYTYDLTDRISKVVHNQREGVLPSVGIDYEYDDSSEDASGKNYGVGRLTSVDNGSSHYSYRYAANGALKAQTIRFPDASAEMSRVSYETDIGGLLTGLTYPNGNLLTYERDSCSGEVTGLLWNGNRLARLSASSQLNAYTLAQLNNGIEISRDFDARNRLNSVKLERATEVLWHQDYEYDNRQNLKTITTQKPLIDVGSNQQFSYDLNNRLESASGNYGALAYTYNDHSHRTTETDNAVKTRYRYYANKDQIKSLVDSTGTSIKDYVYDKDGQRIQAGPWQYSYNAAGRLAEVSKDGVWVASYQYDAYGKRISKQTATGAIYFHHDASGRLLQESNETGNVIRQYIYTDMGELFALVDATGNVNFVHSDYLGTPLFLTSSTGEVVWSAERKPFGETEITKNVIEFPIRLPGQYYDTETGLHYNQQRYYDAETGQYLSTDPLSIAGGHQLYNYAQQNPTSYVDPEGKIAFLVAVPYIVGGVSVGLTGYEVYDTVDGLASGRVTKEDLAAGYLQDKAVAIGFKALPGVGAAAGIAYGYLNKSPVEAVVKGVKTPYGYANQATDAVSLVARSQVENGATLYRIGTTGKSQAAEAQFWSLENPLSAGYAQRYGIPESNVENANFIETATLKLGVPFVTRPAPGIGVNKGGGIEVVVPESGVQMRAFNYGELQ